MRVLIVEDDSALGVFLQKGLALEGHDVDWVGDGEAGLEYFRDRRPDLLVLDLGLPKKDGMQVLEEIGGKTAGTAVLVLTGRSRLEERVRCLDLGADDCMLKPFSFHELTARCRALLRRKEMFADPVLRHGGVEMNRMERKVVCHGRTVELTLKEFMLLEYLMRRQDRCCSRSELLREVWQSGPEGGTNVVDVYVNYVRKKLAGDIGGERCRIIETVRGEGYRIGCEQRSAGESAHYAAALQRVGA